MTDHKFEPFDRVLVRDSNLSAWVPALFATEIPAIQNRYQTVGGAAYLFCIPFNEDTKHLNFTNDSYEPPKPPHEYKWGDRLEVMRNGVWVEGIFIINDGTDEDPCAVLIKGEKITDWVELRKIRPLEPANE